MLQQNGTNLPIWRVFAGAALAVSVLVGFATGGLLFAASLVPGLELPPLLPVLHGHFQVYGFATLMTIVVLYWFLPRLWGAPAGWTGHAWLAFVAFTCGLLSVLFGVLLSQPWLIAVGSLLEAVGALIVASDFLQLLRWQARHGKGKDPVVSTALALAVLALPVSLLGLCSAALGVRASGWTLSYLLAFYGTLVPIALAMSNRLFPLYFRTRLPARGWLSGTLLIAATGLGVRVAGVAVGASTAVRWGCAVQGVGLLGAIAALRLPEPREKRPSAARTLWGDPTAWLAHIAFGSLAVLAVLQLVASGLGWRVPLPLEWHLLGVGFVTALIFGVGTHLLPGFARTRPRSRWAGWCLVAMSLSMLVLRLAAMTTHGTGATLAGAVAGLFGIVSVAIFAWNVGLLGVRSTSS